MRNYFIAYRHTGEDIQQLEERIRTIEAALATHNIKIYATLFDQTAFNQNHVPAGRIMEVAFQKIAAMDGLFVLIMNNDKSEGQLIEVGYAIASKKPVIVAYQKDSNTYVNELANVAIPFDDMADLANKIRDAKL